VSLLPTLSREEAAINAHGGSVLIRKDFNSGGIENRAAEAKKSFCSRT
jgi:hypothetical protein